jgi:hypothetical protein
MHARVRSGGNNPSYIYRLLAEYYNPEVSACAAGHPAAHRLRTDGVAQDYELNEGEVAGPPTPAAGPPHPPRFPTIAAQLASIHVPRF